MSTPAPETPRSRTAIYLRVVSMRDETSTIRSIRLEPLDGASVPSFEAGAHLAIMLPPRRIRRYSICNGPGDRSGYTIGVKREEHGQGGSKKLHERARPGRVLKILPPQNFFPLSPAGPVRFVSGGIGITPILSMIAACEDAGRPFHLTCCVASRAELPFAERIEGLAARGLCHIHFSSVSGRIDFSTVVAGFVPGEQLYCCGSPGFMMALRAAARSWSAQALHFESFTPALTGEGESSFFVIAARSGQRIRVASDSSILAALRDAGLSVESVCESGSCGTCRLPYLAGEPDHRDLVLSSGERRSQIITCVSRAAGSAPLELDV